MSFISHRGHGRLEATLSPFSVIDFTRFGAGGISSIRPWALESGDMRLKTRSPWARSPSSPLTSRWSCLSYLLAWHLRRVCGARLREAIHGRSRCHLTVRHKHSVLEFHPNETKPNQDTKRHGSRVRHVPRGQGAGDVVERRCHHSESERWDQGQSRKRQKLGP